jgi:hypothetical protein
MSWQSIAQRILRHPPWHRGAVPTITTLTHEPPSDQVLAEVYLTHAAIHGPQRLLPEHTLPSPLGDHEREARGGS